MRFRDGWVDVGDSFIHSIVDKRFPLLSAKLMAQCPYRYRWCDWFPNRVRPYFCKIAITLIAKGSLRVARKGRKNMK